MYAKGGGDTYYITVRKLPTMILSVKNVAKVPYALRTLPREQSHNLLSRVLNFFKVLKEKETSIVPSAKYTICRGTTLNLGRQLTIS